MWEGRPKCLVVPISYIWLFQRLYMWVSFPSPVAWSAFSRAFTCRRHSVHTLFSPSINKVIRQSSCPFVLKYNKIVNLEQMFQTLIWKAIMVYMWCIVFKRQLVICHLKDWHLTICQHSLCNFALWSPKTSVTVEIATHWEVPLEWQMTDSTVLDLLILPFTFAFPNHYMNNSLKPYLENVGKF